MNLDPHQVRQAETQMKSADSSVEGRLPEAYQWLLVPEQVNPQAPIVLQAIRLSSGDTLAIRASKKLRSDELLLTSIGSTVLRKYMDDIPLWRGDHVSIKQLVEYFASYLYLPRLVNPDVLVNAVRSGLEFVTWQSETFAYAESYDDSAGRYMGLRGGQIVNISEYDTGLLVKPYVAVEQLNNETVEGPVPPGPTGHGPGPGPGGTDGPAPPQKFKRFHGTVVLDPARVGRDAGRIAEEVISHLGGQVDAEVTVTLEIEAKLPDGASEQSIRAVTENCRTLKFENHGFEKE